MMDIRSVLEDEKAETTNLDLELCRALHEKDADRMIALLAEWLETNALTTSQDFNIPPYLEELLKERQISRRAH